MHAWEILAIAYLSMYVLLLGMILASGMWLRKARKNYDDLRSGVTKYMTQQSWENAMDAADEFADNPPWHVRVITWPVYRKTKVN